MPEITIIQILVFTLLSIVYISISFISISKKCGFIKRNEVVIYATKWMSLEIIMRSERNQAQRPHILYEIFRAGKSIETGSRLVVVQEGGCFRVSCWGER